MENNEFEEDLKHVMSAFYASIEQLNVEDAHPSFDIWSLGITLYTLMAKTEPYREHSDLKRMEAI